MIKLSGRVGRRKHPPCSMGGQATSGRHHTIGRHHCFGSRSQQFEKARGSDLPRLISRIKPWTHATRRTVYLYEMANCLTYSTCVTGKLSSVPTVRTLNRRGPRPVAGESVAHACPHGRVNVCLGWRTRRISLSRSAGWPSLR